MARWTAQSTWSRESQLDESDESELPHLAETWDYLPKTRSRREKNRNFRD